MQHVLPCYINFRKVVFGILCGQPDVETDKRRQKQYLPNAKVNMFE